MKYPLPESSAWQVRVFGFVLGSVRLWKRCHLSQAVMGKQLPSKCGLLA